MKYEVAYLSNTGNTKRLAMEITSMLFGKEVVLTDLAHNGVSTDADAFFIGFGINGDVVPVKIMDALECTERKTVMLFVTCGMNPTDAYKAAIERKIFPFLPDDCNYLGLFLCAGKFPDDMIDHAQEVLQQNKEVLHARMVLENHQITKNHPDEDDMRKLREYVTTHLSNTEDVDGQEQ